MVMPSGSTRTQFASLLLSLTAFCCHADLGPGHPLDRVIYTSWHRQVPYEDLAGGAVGACDIVCLAGVTMLAVAFYQWTGNPPEEADLASAADLVSEVASQEGNQCQHLMRQNWMNIDIRDVSELRKHVAKDKHLAPCGHCRISDQTLTLSAHDLMLAHRNCEEGLQKDLLAAGLSADAVEELFGRLSQLQADTCLYESDPDGFISSMRASVRTKRKEDDSEWWDEHAESREAYDDYFNFADVEENGLNDLVQSKFNFRLALPADLVAAGEFEEALHVLRNRLGVINAGPFEPLFKQVYWATCTAVPALPQSPAINWPLLSEGCHKTGAEMGCVTPAVLFSLRMIMDQVKEGMQLTTRGVFDKALVRFRGALQTIPLSVAADAQEEQHLLALIDTCREYVNFMRMEVARKQLDQVTDVVRNLEMAAYLTCVRLTPAHRYLALQLALTVSFNIGNFMTCASFAKRLIQGSWDSLPCNVRLAAPIDKAKRVLEVCQTRGSDKHEIDFDAQASPEDFRLCAGSFTQIPPTEPVAKCPFCGSMYHASFKGKLCSTCSISEIGANTLGIALRPL